MRSSLKAKLIHHPLHTIYMQLRSTTKAKGKVNDVTTTQPIVTHQPIITQQPLVSHQPVVTRQPEAMETERIMQTSRTVKKPKRKTKAPPLNYDIVSDVLNKKADITVGDLMVAAPKLRRNMAAACRPIRIPVEVTNPEETMAVIEDEDINTTAVYSKEMEPNSLL
ncbi:hypothetical protein G6F18_013395 [Rhizopus arrhizus]|nr:hypothetical protein G6F18_013395 [Rhizopus arrhizus]